nr:MAG TPA: hypothetical protein [Caudoviricetes sp.]
MLSLFRTNRLELLLQRTLSMTLLIQRLSVLRARRLTSRVS